MIAAVLTLMVMSSQATAPVVLPDTPQGKRVATYIQAFNAGDEKAFMTMQAAQIKPDLLAKRSPAERSEMFKRMRADFGTLKVTKVVTASASQIVLLIPNKEGVEATFTFTFDAAAPHYISGIAVEIDRGPGL